ncbi:type II toxin-antitoxin system VapC family toxin [Mycobacterium shinjukuense]|uniref:Twitching motility protein PilT n=1 Tax=Mycobacterium shinjukuense TaxID=398694 RepID=A0A7I7MLS8_9MYCO|nr:type II toxin-antitoxin system VapC family toxin [Mycobacterium shinjukuense]MCV6984401.1 type II toxin-antitoxin system VapC family toxin [Mycobacterium shinjukuense]ORB71007.1 twitching motility protein PilT [Mycobacterium shinjukuense]BBX73126.1 twitching motility protein PilT [Mycobacterium shinjukuense]
MKRYLIDTHVWLWMQSDPNRLCDRTRAIVADTRNNILLSAASAWEIAIKYRLGKLPLPEPPGCYVPDRMRRSGTSPLPVDHAHALRTAELPDHHRDPFDRVLIAQAQLLDLTIISADDQLSAYDVAVVAA